MKPEDRETAMQYLGRLFAIRAFKIGLTDWKGPVKCTFGSYSIQLSMSVVTDEFLVAIRKEERMLLDALKTFILEEPVQ